MTMAPQNLRTRLHPGAEHDPDTTKRTNEKSLLYAGSEANLRVAGSLHLTSFHRYSVRLREWFSPLDIDTLRALVALTDSSTRESWGSVAQIAKEAGVHPRLAARSMAKLRDAGLVVPRRLVAAGEPLPTPPPRKGSAGCPHCGRREHIARRTTRVHWLVFEDGPSLLRLATLNGRPMSETSVCEIRGVNVGPMSVRTQVSPHRSESLSSSLPPNPGPLGPGGSDLDLDLDPRARPVPETTRNESLRASAPGTHAFGRAGKSKSETCLATLGETLVGLDLSADRRREPHDPPAEKEKNGQGGCASWASPNVRFELMTRAGLHDCRAVAGAGTRFQEGGGGPGRGEGGSSVRMAPSDRPPTEEEIELGPWSAVRAIEQIEALERVKNDPPAEASAAP